MHCETWRIKGETNPAQFAKFSKKTRSRKASVLTAAIVSDTHPKEEQL